MPRPPAASNTAEKPDTTERVVDVEAEVEAEVDRTTVHEAPRRRNIGLHIQRALQAQPTGAVLTVTRLASVASAEYPPAVRAQAPSQTVSTAER